MNPDLQSSLFLDGVGGLSQSILPKRIKELQQELLTTLRATPGSPEEQAIVQACRKLGDNIKVAFDKNFEKFDLYSRRNIFVSELPGASVAPQPAIPAVSDMQSKLEELRQEYSELLRARDEKSNAKSEMQQLLKDMKSALFQLKLGCQVLEECDLGSLQEGMAALEVQRRNLVALCHKANELTAYLQRIAPGHPSAVASAAISIPGKRITDEVVLGTTKDMNMVTQSIRGTH